MKTVLRLVAPLALLMLAGCMSFTVREDQWLRPEALAIDPAALKRMEAASGREAEAVALTTSDGTNLRGLFVHDESPRPVAFYLGGDNFKVAKHGLLVAPAFIDAGMDIFMLDYRGYGASEGEPTIEHLMADAALALDYLRQRRPGVPVIVHGYSMGSFVAAELASRAPVDGLVLESAATNVAAWVGLQVPWYGKPFVRIHLTESLQVQSNIERIQRYRGPLLILTGGADRITPSAMSAELLGASASPERCRELVEIPSAGHGDLLLHPQAWAGYRRMLDGIAACRAVAALR
jgi:pimeloyl-ACP methyl ester carboxylesterase